MRIQAYTNEVGGDHCYLQACRLVVHATNRGSSHGLHTLEQYTPQRRQTCFMKSWSHGGVSKKSSLVSDARIKVTTAQA
jgi:hypothetical protein